MRRRRFLQGLLATPLAWLVPKAWLPVPKEHLADAWLEEATRAINSALPPSPTRWFSLTTPTLPPIDLNGPQAYLMELKRLMDDADVPTQDRILRATERQRLQLREG